MLYQQVAQQLVANWSSMADRDEQVPLTAHMSSTVLTCLLKFAFGDYPMTDNSMAAFWRDYDTVRLNSTLYTQTS